MSDRRDIIVTWPKTKPLADYLKELARAERENLVINYRVARLPTWTTLPCDRLTRCFMVYDGFVRGWCQVLYTAFRKDGEVDGWPDGWYIVRSPIWHEIPRLPKRGFQGWHYFDYEDYRA